MGSKAEKQKYIKQILYVLTYIIVIFSFYPFLWFLPQSLGLGGLSGSDLATYLWLHWWYSYPLLITLSWFLFAISKLHSMPKKYLKLLYFAGTALIIGIILATIKNSNTPLIGPLVAIYFVPTLFVVIPSIIGIRQPAFRSRFK